MTKKEELVSMLERVNSVEEMEKVQAKCDEVNAEIQANIDRINELLKRIDDVARLKDIERLVEETAKLS